MPNDLHQLHAGITRLRRRFPADLAVSMTLDGVRMLDAELEHLQTLADRAVRAEQQEARDG